jgi:DNA-binding transcriptional ArsR family regulator
MNEATTRLRGAIRLIDDSNDCAERLKAFADPTRLQLVNALLGGSRTVSDLCEAIDSPMVTVSHHLQKLREAGIVTSQREGQSQVYSLHPDVAPKNRKDMATGRIDLGCCCFELGERSKTKR